MAENFVAAYPDLRSCASTPVRPGVLIRGGIEAKGINRPIVRLLDEQRQGASVVDLLEKMVDGTYRRNIAGTEDPVAHAIQTSGAVAQA